MSITATNSVNPNQATHATRTGNMVSSEYGDGTFKSIMDIQGNVKTIDTTIKYTGGKIFHTHIVDTTNADGSETINTVKTGPDGKTSVNDKLITHNSDGSETINTVRVGADGKTTTSHETITHNADGSETVDTATTGPKGKTTTRDETITTDADGNESISGTIKNADGSKVTLKGTITKTANGTDEVMTRTNAKGKTATYSSNTIHEGDNTVNVHSHTTFSGKDSSDSMVWIDGKPFSA